MIGYCREFPRMFVDPYFMASGSLASESKSESFKLTNYFAVCISGKLTL